MSSINLKIIRDLAKEKNILLKDLASEIGITNAGLQRMLTENTTKIETLEKIASFFKVPINVFFQEKLPVDLDCIEKIEKLSKENEELKIKIDDLLSQIRYLHRDLEDKRNLIDFLRKNNLILQFDTFLALTEPDVEKRTELKRLVIYGGDPRIADEFDKKFETFKKDYWKNISDHFISEENTKSKSK